MPALIGLEQMARWEMRLAFTWASYRAFDFGVQVPLKSRSAGHPYSSLIGYPSREEKTVASAKSEEPSTGDEQFQRQWRDRHSPRALRVRTIPPPPADEQHYHDRGFLRRFREDRSYGYSQEEIPRTSDNGRQYGGMHWRRNLACAKGHHQGSGASGEEEL